jgi:PKHD-type hydroxylase
MSETKHTGRTRNIPTFIQPIESIVLWEGIFTDEECENIIAIGELGEFMKGRFGHADNGGEVDTTFRDTDVVWLEPDQDSTWIFDRLAELTAKVNYDKYQLDLSRFDGFQFSVYNKGGHYKWHTDTHEMPREDGTYRKLSLSVILTDPSEYEGGELVLAEGGNIDNPKVFKPKRGTVVFFYSFIPHTVTPVTSGKRTALVTWAMGPKLV